ncbi:MAG: hypothetical protein PHQ59_01250 [Candidatus Daviesbacteria bacterium]|nr:hypothetical protein [Candidatus Daviesbacteria bacterium]
MLDDTAPTTNSNTIDLPEEPIQQPQEMPQEPPPPAGDGEKSEKYLNQLIDLINQDKLPVSHTDLNKFEVASIEDHYRMDLGDYEVEINHSKQPDTGQDFYIMLFNNIKQIETQGQSCVNKVILAYTHLTEPQFEDFKEASDASIERIKKKEEAKRFAAVMSPIDELLGNLSSNTKTEEEPIQETMSESKPEENTNYQTEDLADFEDSKEEINNDSMENSPKASDFLTSSQPTT